MRDFNEYKMRQSFSVPKPCFDLFGKILVTRREFSLKFIFLHGEMFEFP
jgi:hypothetical protein